MIENDDNGALRTVAWSELFPWLGIFRCFRMAVDFRLLLLAAVGMLLTATAWSVVYEVFAPNPALRDASLQKAENCPWMAVTGSIPDTPLGSAPVVAPVTNGDAKPRELPVVPPYEPTRPGAGPAPLTGPFLAPDGTPHVIPAAPGVTPPDMRDAFLHPWHTITAPLLAIFNLGARISDFAALLLCVLLAVAIWAFFGAAITRIVAVQFARGERLGLVASLRFACSKWRAYFAAPLLPLLGILLAAIPAYLIALVLMHFNLGILLAAIVWPLLLALGLVMTLLLLGLMFGWPLMWGTISSEGTDSFDALSRSYAYVFQRPLHYLFYAVVATLFGALGWLLVRLFTATVIGLTYWAAHWGASETITNLLPGAVDQTGLAGSGGALIHFWTGCVKVLATGFLFSYFWAAATVIYFLLRRNVDHTELDEVYLDADESQPAYDLPAVHTDPQGAPVVGDQPSTAEQPAAAEQPTAEEPAAEEPAAEQPAGQEPAAEDESADDTPAEGSPADADDSEEEKPTQ